MTPERIAEIKELCRVWQAGQSLDIAQTGSFLCMAQKELPELLAALESAEDVAETINFHRIEMDEKNVKLSARIAALEEGLRNICNDSQVLAEYPDAIWRSIAEARSLLSGADAGGEK